MASLEYVLCVPKVGCMRGCFDRNQSTCTFFRCCEVFDKSWEISGTN